MREDAVQMCLLFDFYGSILTERQQELFDLYYNEDLSLAEIAEHREITRQGVRDALARSRGILMEMEEKLGLVRRFRENSKALAKIRALAEELLALNGRLLRSVDFERRAQEIWELAVEH